jgi:hypothetical protein
LLAERIDGGKMPKVVIIGFVALALVSLLVFVGSLYLSPSGVETKGESGSLAVQYVSLATSIVSLLTALVGLVNAAKKKHGGDT